MYLRELLAFFGRNNSRLARSKGKACRRAAESAALVRSGEGQCGGIVLLGALGALPAGLVVRGVAVLGGVAVVVPEVIPPMLDVGDVLPIGGVVPEVVFGVVPVVVFGVVPVVFGVVPVVEPGVAALGIVVLPVLGGQMEVEVLEAEPGNVDVEFGEALEVLVGGEDAVVELVDGIVVLAAQVVDGVAGRVMDGAAPGVVLCILPVDELPDCVPGTGAVEVLAPVDVCAAARLAATHTTHARIHAGVFILQSPVGLRVGWPSRVRRMLKFASCRPAEYKQNLRSSHAVTCISKARCGYGNR